MENMNLNAEVVAGEAAQVAAAQSKSTAPARIDNSALHLSTTKAGLVGAAASLAINLVDQAICENWSVQRTACSVGASVVTGGIIAACHNGLEDVYDSLESKAMETTMAGTWGMSFGLMLGAAANGATNTIRGMLAEDKADTEEFLAQAGLIEDEQIEAA